MTDTLKLPRSEATNVAMVAGNERKFTKVIDGEDLKEWVGIGWIILRKATPADKKRYITLEAPISWD
jgi:hypothetical protein